MKRFCFVFDEAQRHLQ